MKWSTILAPVVLLVAAVSLAAASRVVSVEPALASPGDELVASGSELVSANVAELYLTVGASDIAVEILEQSADQMRFRLPTDLPNGQYNLMLLTAGDTPAFLVQPVMCEVLDATAIAERRTDEAREQREIDAAVATDPAPQQ
jgi:hypothetical protein